MRIEINGDRLPWAECSLTDVPADSVLWSSDGGRTFNGIVLDHCTFRTLGRKFDAEYLVVGVDQDVQFLSWLDEGETITAIAVHYGGIRLVSSSMFPAAVSAAISALVDAISEMPNTSLRRALIYDVRALNGHFTFGIPYRSNGDGGWELAVPVPVVLPGDEDLSDIPL